MRVRPNSRTPQLFFSTPGEPYSGITAATQVKGRFPFSRPVTCQLFRLVQVDTRISTELWTNLEASIITGQHSW